MFTKHLQGLSAFFFFKPSHHSLEKRSLCIRNTTSGISKHHFLKTNFENQNLNEPQVLIILVSATKAVALGHRQGKAL